MHAEPLWNSLQNKPVTLHSIGMDAAIRVEGTTPIVSVRLFYTTFSELLLLICNSSALCIHKSVCFASVAALRLIFYFMRGRLAHNMAAG